jgi:CheY-like chemotaxis protein/HD-like signal output (HDOD) protein
MKSVLFVDDEPRILEGIDNLLFDLDEDWDVHTADSGRKALELLSARRFDVLVTDMRMPGMDGPALLSVVRELYPDIALFVLSGHADKEALLSTLGSVHRFLAKPCDGLHLIKTLQDTAGFLDEVSSGVKRNIGRATRLPAASSFSMVGCRTSRAELVRKVESDAAAAIRVLRAADLFLKSDAATTNISMAIDRLGEEFTHLILCSMVPPSTFDGIKQDIIDELHAHGRLVAECARAIAGDAEWKETAYMTGLVHDIAHLVSYSIDPKSFSESPLVNSHNDSHASMGATVLGLWGFRKEVTDVVANHHNLKMACESYPSLMGSVVLAECLSFSVIENSPCEAQKYLPSEILSPLRSKVEAVIERIQNESSQNPVH